MIEKVPTNVRNYQKKITAYLDGSLSPEERSEFEAFVATHPEFNGEVKAKEEQIRRIRELIPVLQLSVRARESLDTEIKQSVFNLLKPVPKNFWEGLKDRFEEWTANR